MGKNESTALGFDSWIRDIIAIKDDFTREVSLDYFASKVLPLLISKSYSSDRLSDWQRSFTECASLLSDAFGEDKKRAYLKTIFLRDLESASYYYDLNRIIGGKIRKAEEREIAKVEAKKEKLALTPRIVEAIERLKRHLTENLEEKYRAAKEKDEHNRMESW